MRQHQRSREKKQGPRAHRGNQPRFRESRRSWLNVVPICCGRETMAQKLHGQRRKGWDRAAKLRGKHGGPDWRDSKRPRCFKIKGVGVHKNTGLGSQGRKRTSTSEQGYLDWASRQGTHIDGFAGGTDVFLQHQK